MISEQEKVLINKARQGDEGCFETLILSCRGKAYNIALRYIKNEHDAMDILQESFIKVFRNLDKFNENSKFETWVYRIVVNTCHDFLRKKKDIFYDAASSKGNDEDETAAEPEIADREPTPEEAVLNREHSSYILECLNELTDEQKEIIILRDIQQFSYEEISEIQQCSIGTVKSRISRARNRLKEIYLKNKF